LFLTAGSDSLVVVGESRPNLAIFRTFSSHSYRPEDRVIDQPPPVLIMAETLHKVAEALHISDETKRISFEND
jgi:hypothetical protein